MEFLRAYSSTIARSWPARLLLGIPTVVGVVGAIVASGEPWRWISLVLLGIILVQLYVAYVRWSPVAVPVGAVRDEIEYIRRRLHEWDADFAIADLATPTLPATEWNKHRDTLRLRLPSDSYGVTFDFFDAIDRFNRERANTSVGPDLDGLAAKLETADAALAKESERS